MIKAVVVRMFIIMFMVMFMILFMIKAVVMITSMARHKQHSGLKQPPQSRRAQAVLHDRHSS